MVNLPYHYGRAQVSRGSIGPNKMSSCVDHITPPPHRLCQVKSTFKQHGVSWCSCERRQKTLEDLGADSYVD